MALVDWAVAERELRTWEARNVVVFTSICFLGLVRCWWLRRWKKGRSWRSGDKEDNLECVTEGRGTAVLSRIVKKVGRKEELDRLTGIE